MGTGDGIMTFAMQTGLLALVWIATCWWPAFVRATRLRPDLGEVHNNVATTLVAMGELDDAVVEFVEAVRLQPDSVAMRINLANACASAERGKSAGERWRGRRPSARRLGERSCRNTGSVPPAWRC